MDFLAKTDFAGTVATTIMTQLQGTADANLIQAEQLAISELDPLRFKFNIEGELAKTTTDRNKAMIRLMVSLTAYWLYNTVADLDIPERITDNYKTALRDIELFSQGKKHATFDQVIDDAGNVVTKFEYGFETKRNNNPFH